MVGFTPGFVWALLVCLPPPTTTLGNNHRHHLQLQGTCLTRRVSTPRWTRGLEFRALPAACTLAGTGRALRTHCLCADRLCSFTDSPAPNAVGPEQCPRGSPPAICLVISSKKTRLTSFSTKWVLSSFRQLSFCGDNIEPSVKWWPSSD